MIIWIPISYLVILYLAKSGSVSRFYSTMVYQLPFHQLVKGIPYYQIRFVLVSCSLLSQDGIQFVHGTLILPDHATSAQLQTWVLLDDYHRYSILKKLPLIQHVTCKTMWNLFSHLVWNFHKIFKLLPQVIPVQIYEVWFCVCPCIPQALANNKSFWIQMDNICLNFLNGYLKMVQVLLYEVQGDTSGFSKLSIQQGRYGFYIDFESRVW